ncbi:hypothetical protein [Bacillus weihaiensis]|uniref:Uncharacterized protein n=1 Tax=Bacillus weihaiensis TaxID=1547283 RepID=A0A1L3MU33_9BACI|nr:hypothetical protein [Bacillus weihaiensis]APH05848.1 hypothetical protein A9C19_14510 [Bacillus weihaiensis]
MIVDKKYKCLNCNTETNIENSEQEKIFKLIIPNEIVPNDSLELVYANHYKFGHHKFCNEKCYNLKVLDNAINDLTHSLNFPEDHFLPLHFDRDISKAKDTLIKLKEFKETLQKN